MTPCAPHQLTETDREHHGPRILVYTRCDRCGYEFAAWHDTQALLRRAREVAENVPKGWVE